MTGGQAAPTTPEGAIASTTPGGNVEPDFDACKLMIGAGASYVARVLAANPLEMTKIMADGLTHPGFAFIEVVSDCPEYFGRYNRVGRGSEMLSWMARRDSDVAVPLSLKGFVNHIPSSPTPTGIKMGVLEREIRPTFAGTAFGARP